MKVVGAASPSLEAVEEVHRTKVVVEPEGRPLEEAAVLPVHRTKVVEEPQMVEAEEHRKEVVVDCFQMRVAAAVVAQTGPWVAEGVCFEVLEVVETRVHRSNLHPYRMMKKRLGAAEASQTEEVEEGLVDLDGNQMRSRTSLAEDSELEQLEEKGALEEPEDS